MSRLTNLCRMAAVLALSLMGSVSLRAQATDPFPGINQHDFFGNMSMTVQVFEDGLPLVQDVIVAVYSGQTLRGKGTPQDPSRPGVIYLTVYGDNSGDRLYFKVCARGNIVEVVPEDLTYIFNEVVGTPKNPYAINIAGAGTEEKTTFELKLAKGWNWISHNRANALNPTSLFGSNVLEVKSQTKGVMRDPKFGMVGNLKEMVATESYKVKTTSADTKPYQIEDYSFRASIHPVTLREGWNWIGYPMASEATIEEALKNFSPKDGDMLVGQEDFTSYTGGSWIGTLTKLTPGKGYMYKSGAAKPLYFNSKAEAKVRAEAGMRRVGEESPWTCDIYKYPNRMPTTVCLYKDNRPEEVEDYDVAAFCGDECRAVGKAVKGVVMMNVCGEGGEAITFKALDRNTGIVLKIEESVPFTGDVLGTYTEPFRLTLGEEESTGIETVYSPQLTVDNNTVYNVAGLRMTMDEKALPKGVYIIRMKDGKTKTVFVR